MDSQGDAALGRPHLRGSEAHRGSANNWWERSPNGSNSTNFCNVNSNGNANYNNASNANGVAFGFCKRWVRTVTGSGEAAPLQKESLFPA